jgi:predicted XRE-type DNA-binding protein
MSARTKRNAKPADVHTGSGNVFADLRLPNPEELQHKADLAREVITLVNARGMTQKAAAALLGIDQPKVSDLMRGNLKAFSIERLLTFLTKLDRHIEIVVSPARKNHRAGLFVVAGT